MIRTSHVGKKYGEKAVLSDIGIDIPKHALTTLIGANGAGKSTLLSIISRLSEGEGQVDIDGKPVSAYRSDELARLMSTLRQTNHISVRLTVRELISFGRYPHAKTRLGPEDRRVVEQAIALMELENYADRFIDQLSGGERQRAFIAMVIAQDTPYILLDEPLNNLDMKHSVQIMKLLRNLVDEHGKTVVLVLHDINFASAYSDCIVSLRDGRLVGVGMPEEMIRPDVLRQVYDMDIEIREIDGRRFCMYFT